MRRLPNVWLNYCFCVLLCVSLSVLFYIPQSFSTVFRQASNHPTVTEIRGVWLTNVSSWVLFAPWSINRAIKRLSQLNFNTIYPVVWNRGYTFYPSNVAKKATGKLADPWVSLMRGRSDLLAEIIQVAHKEGLSVIPWFEYGLIVPANSSIAKNHPQWLTKNQKGKYFLKENQTDRDFLNVNSKQKNPLSRRLQVQHQQRVKQLVWLNPFHPEVQKFMKTLIMEVVVNYDVDGIQLDDHFGLPVELGYDPLTVKLYQKDHHGKKPPSDPRSPEWMRWRATKLTTFMTDIVKTIKKVKPNVRISLSPNSHSFSYQNYLQDWQTWVKRGLVDELVLQVYQDNLKRFQKELSQSAVGFSRRHIPVSVGILTGTWNRPVSIKQIEQQVKLVRDRGFAGVSFFYWETLWGYLTPESPHQRRQVFRKLFIKPAFRPKLANKSP